MKAVDSAALNSERPRIGADELSRRRFLTATAGVAVPGLLSTASLAADPTTNENPGKTTMPRAGGLKVGLYSITFLGLWYRGKELALEEVVRRAKQYGYDGMEIDGKRPHANPLDWPNAPLPGTAKVRRRGRDRTLCRGR